MKNIYASEEAARVKKPDRFRIDRALRRFYWLVGCIALSLFLSGFSLRAATLPAGFTETQVGSNFSGTPTAMAFAPDGRLFVCQQGGELRVIENGILLTTPFVTVTTTANGERGLLGIAFDPDFPNNQFVYVYYTDITAPIHNRVSRFTANGNVAVTGSERPILELNNLSSATNHNGGGIHFGADGKLYVGVGENANPANSQSLANRLGKLLRINADGTIPSDNPTTFPGITGSSTGKNRAIWAVGLRNPYTFAFQPGTGRLFINDVGQSTWEEINDGIVDSNYGWSICEGFCSPPNANYRDPLFEYGHGSSDTTGCAIVGGTFYNPAINQFPASYIGKYFFSDLCSGWIRLMDPSNNTASAFATGLSTPVDLKVGPEGSLYYLIQGNGGQVWKISTTPTGTPTPTPTATPTSTPGQPPAAPTNLLATAISSSQIALSWTDNANNETGFQVQRSNNGVNFTTIVTLGANSTTYTDNGLTPATTYYYRVAAFNSSGHSGASNVANATTLATSTPTPTPSSTPTATPPPTPTPGQPPAAPTNLGATAISSSQIALSWTDNANNETGFQIQRSNNGVNFATIATLGANVITYTDNGRTPATTYYYRLAAFNSSGHSASSNVASATTLPASTPNPAPPD